ncbi:MAG: serine/threonine protein kinase, partial [Candidatus Saccharimonas sp.]|nr:serine/threonine protein kinase [Planctomycetaceae bacterium]
IVSLVCLAAFFLRALLLDEPLILFVRSVSLIISVGCLGLLSSPGPLSTKRLRRIELLLFGPLCAFVVFLQVFFLMKAVDAGDDPQQVAVVYSGVLGLAVMMLAYGMLMPNGWRRTAAMMVPPVAAPTVAMLIVRHFSPSVAEVIDATRAAEIGFALIVTGLVTTYGTHTISTLRREARRARQLGQYRLKQELGQGGMGQVYLAEHQLLKRPCAIKVIQPGHGADPAALARFEREVRSTARLSHWNTVEIFDYGHTDDGTFYYVMEYMRGLNLSELVKRYGSLPPGRAIHFLSQTCWALQEAHNLGLIHRDLKPANIFAAKRGGVYDVTKLFDFGLVMQRNEGENFYNMLDTNTTTPFAGSPLFMSPEQAAGLKLDGRTDVYSLGCVGYYLLTGRPPFEGKSSWRVMLAHARDALTPPTHWTPDAPKDLEAVLVRCLSKKPEDRFGSPREMAEALAKCKDAHQWNYEHAANWWKEHAAEIDPTLLHG